MGWFQRTRKGWERAKAGAYSVQSLPPHMPLAGWANGDQMVYEINPAFLEIGQGGLSPMRGWGAIIFAGVIFLILAFLVVAVPTSFSAWEEGEISSWMFGAMLAMATIMTPISAIPIAYFILNFLTVTDPPVRVDHKRQKVWMWTSKGTIEINWANLVPRVESSVATAYATVKTYRGQYAELASDGNIKVSHGIPHVFQVGQISAAEEGVRPSMEYVRLYMEAGPHAVKPPNKLLSHRPRWYAMVNFLGMADEWVSWSENRDKPGVAPAPWTRTIIFALLLPLLFPLQFTNWLALMVAPKPKWPKALDAMLQADRLQYQGEETQRQQKDSTIGTATESGRPRRKPVIRVNGEIVEDDSGS